MAAATRSVPVRSDIILEQFSIFRSELDQHNDRRDRLIKSSRDVTTLSKRLIFHLHRCPPGDAFQDSTSASALIKEALTKRDEIVTLIKGVAQDEALDRQAQHAEKGRAIRYDRAYGPGLEEFIEAVTFLHFLQFGTVMTLDEVQGLFVELDGNVVLPVTPQRYLLGISDLTGELMRFATNALGSPGDSQSVVAVVLDTLRHLTSAMDPFIPLIFDFRKKQRVTVQSMRKIEDLSYAVKVRSSEYGSDPKALREMVKRALAAGGGSSSSSNSNHRATGPDEQEEE